MDNAGQSGEAMRIPSGIGNPTMRSLAVLSAMTSMLRETVRRGDIERAIKQARLPKDDGTKADLLAFVADQMVQVGKCDRLAQVVAQAIAVAGKMKERDFQSLTLLKIGVLIASEPAKMGGREPKQVFDGGEIELALRTLEALVA